MTFILGPDALIGEPSTASAATCGPWATAADVCAPCNEPGVVDGPLLARCLQVASEVLYELTGRKWTGVCEDEIRPSARNVGGDVGRPIGGSGFWWTAGPIAGTTSAWGFCGCNQSERFGCSGPSEVPLPGYPVVGVIEVVVDGVTLVDGVDYTVRDGRYLVRMADAAGASRSWPCCQRMDIPAGSVGTWTVRYSYGRLPSTAAVFHCANYACQLALAATPAKAGECRLPKRIQTITRQGITAVAFDPMAFIDKGGVGLSDVDTWIHAVNPNHVHKPARAFHPAIRRGASRPA